MARLTIDKARLIGPGSGALVRFIRLVHRTARIVCDPPDAVARFASHHPMIFAMWHGQFMMLPVLNPSSVKVRIMVARHGDAELIGGVLQQFGMDLIRGAGAGGRKRDRGGARALLAARAALDEGFSVGMTADVPPGPARRAGLGIVMLAKISGKPIVPVAVASSRYRSLDTWSRMTINLPWSTIGVVVGEPIRVAAEADEAALEAARLAVEQAMNDATRRAYAICGADPARATPDTADPSAAPAPPGRRLKLYRALMRAAEPLAPAILSWREARGKEDPARRGERLGFAGRPRPPGTLIWVHAASVGETNAALPMIAELRARRPDVHFLVTTGTLTSAALAASRLDRDDVHQFVPLDSPRFVARFLDHWMPDLAIFTESEIWPNLIVAAADRAVPLALVNARMSARSYSRWMKQRAVSRPLFNRFAVVLAQTEKLSRWFRDLGARQAIAAGNLKVDAPPPPVDAAALAGLQAALGDRPRLIVASTHGAEEEVAAEAHRILTATWPDFCTIIAPRHPVRGPQVVAMLDAKGIPSALRSKGAMPDAATQVYVADTIGELGTLFRLAPLAFLGKSLGIGPGTTGGQNPIEAIRHGVGVITGPHCANFHEIYQTLFRSNGAVAVTSAATLASEVQRLLTEPAALAALHANATGALEKMSGALSTTVDELLRLLPVAPAEVAAIEGAPRGFERATR
jgi:3-deoxy-D-manno-octulosonic-acid transferase